MVIYVLFRDHVYAEEVIGVFSTEELAKKWIEARVNYVPLGSREEMYRIMCFDLDKPLLTSWENTLDSIDLGI